MCPLFTEEKIYNRVKYRENCSIGIAMCPYPKGLGMREKERREIEFTRAQ